MSKKVNVVLNGSKLIALTKVGPHTYWDRLPLYIRSEYRGRYRIERERREWLFWNTQPSPLEVPSRKPWSTFLGKLL